MSYQRYQNNAFSTKTTLTLLNIVITIYTALFAAMALTPTAKTGPPIDPCDMVIKKEHKPKDEPKITVWGKERMDPTIDQMLETGRRHRSTKKTPKIEPPKPKYKLLTPEEAIRANIINDHIKRATETLKTLNPNDPKDRPKFDALLKGPTLPPLKDNK